MKGYNSDYDRGDKKASYLINCVDYNIAGLCFVGQVDSVDVTIDEYNLSIQGVADSVTQNYMQGHLFAERYFGSDGTPYLDIHYTNHGNEKIYPNFFHYHKIRFEDREMKRNGIDMEVRAVDKKQLMEYISQRREIEFNYMGNKYSITYGVIDEREVISFCQFYQETTEVENVEELLNVTRGGITVLEMLESLSEGDIWIS